jgi:hypothetical protein
VVQEEGEQKIVGKSDRNCWGELKSFEDFGFRFRNFCSRFGSVPDDHVFVGRENWLPQAVAVSTARAVGLRGVAGVWNHSLIGVWRLMHL